MTRTRPVISVWLVMALLFIGVLSGCATSRSVEVPARHNLDEFPKEKVASPFDVYDPIEGFNRGVYRFNYYFDTFFYLPIVEFYETITPNFVQDRVSNFFDNISEVSTLANCLLQFKGGCVVKTVGRVAINSTVGIGGLWDPATHWGIDRQREDFGQTLGYYGIGDGPYLVLPVFGPSNLRDAFGLAAEKAAFEVIDPFNFEHNEEIGAAFYTTGAVDQRHKIRFRYFDSGSPFEYELIRMLYAKYRQAEIKK